LATLVPHVPSNFGVEFSWTFDVFRTWIFIFGGFQFLRNKELFARRSYFIIQESKLTFLLPFLLIGFKRTPLICETNFLVALCAIEPCDAIS
jgi:hypothetical protein